MPDGFEDGYWWSNDGLRLHYRDYGRTGAGGARPPILCIPGLTRNCRDFERLAAALAPDWRVLALEMRGRGESGFAKDAMTYAPLTYVQDVERLLATLEIERFVAFGTSLGGIVSLLLAASARSRLEGLLLNDIGPAIEPAGLQRIRDYVGRPSNMPTWMHAARAQREANEAIHPDWGVADWIAFAKRIYRLTPQGRIVLDYDMRIAEPFRVPDGSGSGSGGGGGVDLWPSLDRLGGVPALVVRGERSDILSRNTAQAMADRLHGAELIEVPRVGHAPTLDEPVARKAIARLLARVDSRAT